MSEFDKKRKDLLVHLLGSLQNIETLPASVEECAHAVRKWERSVYAHSRGNFESYSRAMVGIIGEFVQNKVPYPFPASPPGFAESVSESPASRSMKSLSLLRENKAFLEAFIAEQMKEIDSREGVSERQKKGVKKNIDAVMDAVRGAKDVQVAPELIEEMRRRFLKWTERAHLSIVRLQTDHFLTQIRDRKSEKVFSTEIEEVRKTIERRRVQSARREEGNGQEMIEIHPFVDVKSTDESEGVHESLTNLERKRPRESPVVENSPFWFEMESTDPIRQCERLSVEEMRRSTSDIPIDVRTTYETMSQAAAEVFRQKREADARLDAAKRRRDELIRLLKDECEAFDLSRTILRNRLHPSIIDFVAELVSDNDQEVPKIVLRIVCPFRLPSLVLEVSNDYPSKSVSWKHEEKSYDRFNDGYVRAVEQMKTELLTGQSSSRTFRALDVMEAWLKGVDIVCAESAEEQKRGNIISI